MFFVRNAVTPWNLGTLILGIFAGFTIFLIFLSEPRNPTWMPYLQYHSNNFNDKYNHSSLKHSHLGPIKDVGSHNENEEVHALEDKSLAAKLYNEVRVLCWVATHPGNYEKKAQHVHKTWGKRCNKILFMSSSNDKHNDTISLPINEGRETLWGKTKEAFKYIHKNYLNDYDWFLKADDDTYVIVENLRLLLFAYSSEQPIYFGCKFRTFVQQGFMSGGAGYVLSREAVRKLVEVGITNKTLCVEGNIGAEDVELGKCLANINILAGDSRDSMGRGRFFPFVPQDHLIPQHLEKEFWYWKYIYYDTHDGLNCCSDNAISFHYVPPNQMYVLDYLIYHLKPYGIVSHSQPLPKKLSISEITQKLKESDVKKVTDSV